MGSAPLNVVEFEEALAIVLREAGAKAGATRVKLLEAAGRVMAQDVQADRDQPPFDRATRDGFAVRAAEWVAGAKARILGQVRAGERWSGGAVRADEAVEIMTGAPVPEGADAVAMVEHVQRGPEWVQAAAGHGLDVGGNVVARGSEARAGQTVVAAGTRVGAAEIALAATCGLAEVAVFARPRVAIVATGDELVEVSEIPREQQIRNSNSYAIAAMVTAAGGDPTVLAIARDVREEVREQVAQGRMGDLMVLSGGVSMGEYDLVEEVLEEFGAEFLFTGVKMQPGKPVVFGRLPARQTQPECFFFGLPGNPISTQVTFHCFAEIFLRALGGEAESAAEVGAGDAGRAGRRAAGADAFAAGADGWGRGAARGVAGLGRPGGQRTGQLLCGAAPGTELCAGRGDTGAATLRL